MMDIISANSMAIIISIASFIVSCLAYRLSRQANEYNRAKIVSEELREHFDTILSIEKQNTVWIAELAKMSRDAYSSTLTQLSCYNNYRKEETSHIVEHIIRPLYDELNLMNNNAVSVQDIIIRAKNTCMLSFDISEENIDFQVYGQKQFKKNVSTYYATTNSLSEKDYSSLMSGFESIISMIKEKSDSVTRDIKTLEDIRHQNENELIKISQNQSLNDVYFRLLHTFQTIDNYWIIQERVIPQVGLKKRDQLLCALLYLYILGQQKS